MYKRQTLQTAVNGIVRITRCTVPERLTDFNINGATPQQLNDQFDRHQGAIVDQFFKAMKAAERLRDIDGQLLVLFERIMQGNSNFNIPILTLQELALTEGEIPSTYYADGGFFRKIGTGATAADGDGFYTCLLYTSPSPRD